MMNNKSDVIDVNPEITHYTVYIFYPSAARMNDSVNVTETSFRHTNYIPCPIYQVSAWNSAGEGELTEPLQESTVRGK